MPSLRGDPASVTRAAGIYHLRCPEREAGRVSAEFPVGDGRPVSVVTPAHGQRVLRLHGHPEASGRRQARLTAGRGCLTPPVTQPDGKVPREGIPAPGDFPDRQTRPRGTPQRLCPPPTHHSHEPRGRLTTSRPLDLSRDCGCTEMPHPPGRCLPPTPRNAAGTHDAVSFHLPCKISETTEVSSQQARIRPVGLGVGEGMGQPTLFSPFIQKLECPKKYF